MPKTKKRSVKSKKKSLPSEPDTLYMLKLVIYLVIGSQWIRISKGLSEFPIPLGFLLGLLFSMHEHFQIDRKIEYAVLLMAMFLGFWIPMGIQISIR